MHWPIDIDPSLGRDVRVQLARWFGPTFNAGTDRAFVRMRPIVRALPAAMYATRHPMGDHLSALCLDAVAETVGTPVWPVWGSLRVCERGDRSPMHVDINPFSDLALFFDLSPPDHNWPFRVERDAGGIEEVRTSGGQGCLVETHRTRHGRAGRLDIERSAAAVLRYTRDPSTALARAPRAPGPGGRDEVNGVIVHRQAFDPREVSCVDANGWHAYGGPVNLRADETDGQFGSAGGWYGERLDAMLGAYAETAYYHRIRPEDGPLRLSGRLCAVVLGVPVRGGEVRSGPLTAAQGDVLVSGTVEVEPVVSGEQRVLVAYAG